MLYITGRHEASSTVLQGSLNLVDLAGRCGSRAGGRHGVWAGGGRGMVGRPEKTKTMVVWSSPPLVPAASAWRAARRRGSARRRPATSTRACPAWGTCSRWEWAGLVVVLSPLSFSPLQQPLRLAPLTSLPLPLPAPRPRRRWPPRAGTFRTATPSSRTCCSRAWAAAARRSCLSTSTQSPSRCRCGGV